MIGPVVAEHFATPAQNLIRSIAADDHAEFPCGQVLEHRIEFAIEEGLFIMQVALDRIHGGRCVRLVRCVGLLNRLGVLQASR